jgi:proteasome lid subunit RPN8/RPN11
VAPLKIEINTYNAIITHAERVLPHEACGYLAKKNGVVCHHYELSNTDQAADHFSMDPKEQFAAIKDMRMRGLTLCAVYHSHPETPARASAEDIRLAYDPDINYVIISMMSKDRVVRSFKICKGAVTPVPFEVLLSNK